MLSAPKTSDPKAHDDPATRDSSADFIQELAESGTPSELATVKAASDAAEKDAKAAAEKKRAEAER